VTQNKWLSKSHITTMEQLMNLKRKSEERVCVVFSVEAASCGETNEF
jgi:hypothetical protein